jgi:hypothetical protein
MPYVALAKTFCYDCSLFLVNEVLSFLLLKFLNHVFVPFFDVINYVLNSFL